MKTTFICALGLLCGFCFACLGPPRSGDAAENSQRKAVQQPAEKKDDDKAWHPLIRRLLELLDDEEEKEGSAQQRRMLRRTLRNADEVLKKQGDPLRLIRSANRSRRHPVVGSRYSRIGRVRPAIRRPPVRARRERPGSAKSGPAKAAKTKQ